jgi:hypothetical protein
VGRFDRRLVSLPNHTTVCVKTPRQKPSLLPLRSLRPLRFTFFSSFFDLFDFFDFAV